MRLSKRGEYGLRALQDLARHYGEEPVSNKVLAESNNIPYRFLEQILLALKHGRIVRSRKGAKGGYYLARPPQQITLAEVVRLLDGPLAPISCVSTTSYEPCGCPDMNACGLRRVMQQVRDAVAGMMESTTLADITEQTTHWIHYVPHDVVSDNPARSQVSSVENTKAES